MIGRPGDVLDPDPVRSEIIWLHGNGYGSVIGWFPGSGSETKIIYYEPKPSDFKHLNFNKKLYSVHFILKKLKYIK